MFKTIDPIDINISYIDEGILIDIRFKKGRNSARIEFPINKNKNIIKSILASDKYFKILILEDLWLEDLLEVIGNSYIIKGINLYEMKKEILKQLELPHYNDIRIKVKSRNYVGNKNFNIDYSLISEEYGILDGFYKRYGNIIIFDNIEMLLSKEQLALLEEIDNYSVTDDINRQAIHLAKVKRKAEKANAEIDDYIKNEQYYFPERIDIEFNKHDDTLIELIPYLEGLDRYTNEVLMNIDNVSTINSFTDEKGRKRVFLDEIIASNFNKIRENKIIKGSQVPRFIKNPSEFLPDGIDLDKFSDRVKGLKIRTYKVRPFVDCERDSSTGWFEFNTEIRLEKELNISLDLDDELNTFEEDNSIINLKEYANMLELAKRNGEDYIYYNGKWIEIDHNEGEKFLEAQSQLKDMFSNGKVNIKNLHYVLEIYDNIEKLEYSNNFIRLKEELAKEKIFEYEKPRYLNANLYTYQKEGFNWLKLLKYQMLGGLLADDMGLGKTLQIIAFMAYLKEINELKPSLIVVPATLIDNWISEIEKFTYGLGSIYIHRGSERIKDSQIIKDFDIVITTYETLVRDQVILGEIDWNLLAIDEAQKIKNATTLIASAVKAQKRKIPVAITGTPVENSLSELWSIVDFVQPGLLRNYSWFRREFQVPIEKNIGNTELINNKSNELIKTIEPVFLRRIKEDKLDNLPEIEEEFIFSNLSNYQEQLYVQIINRIKSEDSKRFVLAYLQQLIQICSHPRIVTGNLNIEPKTLIKESNKLKDTLSLLKNIERLNEKVVIFTKYRNMQQILRKVIFNEFGIWPNVINGDMNRNRIKIISDFESKDGFNVLILSPRAAGVGLNITGANHVIHYTREWNPAVEKQATDRVYRIGQKRDVKVYYPISVSDRGITVEVKLNELLNKKKKLFNSVIIPMEKMKVTEDELLEGII
ncbi:MAG: DEAD/DEAH box helicase [Tissierellia bacterium]|nr:DEAD/DEAH box helicase [Tissierellia bacterium]